MSYVELKWSKGLADDARYWAGELLDDCHVIGIEHEPEVEQGEKLVKQSGVGSFAELYPVDNIVYR